MVNKTNLLAGIDFWFTKKKHWPDDFHNQVYRDLEKWRSKGINQEWWREIASLLQFWQANRPFSEKQIFDSGLPHLNAINKRFTEIKEKHGEYPSVENIDDDVINDIFNVAGQIKKIKKKSPVFPSKLCHFLFPTIFFIADRDTVRMVDADYFEYWRSCKQEWCKSQNKEELIFILRNHIEKSKKFDLLLRTTHFQLKLPSCAELETSERHKIGPVAGLAIMGFDR